MNNDSSDSLLAGTALLTAKQLAQALSISEQSIYSYASRGLIPYIKIESNLRFNPRAIRAWLAEKECRTHSHRCSD